MAPDNDLYQEARAILEAVGDRLGVPVQDARLLRLHSNASFALAEEGLLVRIATNPSAYVRVAASIEVTRWLAGRGFPCVVPADIEGQPFTVHGRVVSVWRYVPTTTGPVQPGAELGRLLRLLHAQPDPPCPPGGNPHPASNLADAPR